MRALEKQPSPLQSFSNPETSSNSQHRKKRPSVTFNEREINILNAVADGVDTQGFACRDQIVCRVWGASSLRNSFPKQLTDALHILNEKLKLSESSLRVQSMRGNTRSNYTFVDELRKEPLTNQSPEKNTKKRIDIDRTVQETNTITEPQEKLEESYKRIAPILLERVKAYCASRNGEGTQRLEGIMQDARKAISYVAFSNLMLEAILHSGTFPEESERLKSLSPLAALRSSFPKGIVPPLYREPELRGWGLFAKKYMIDTVFETWNSFQNGNKPKTAREAQLYRDFTFVSTHTTLANVLQLMNKCVPARDKEDETSLKNRRKEPTHGGRYL